MIENNQENRIPGHSGSFKLKNIDMFVSSLLENLTIVGTTVQALARLSNRDSVELLGAFLGYSIPPCHELPKMTYHFE